VVAALDLVVWVSSTPVVSAPHRLEDRVSLHVEAFPQAMRCQLVLRTCPRLVGISGRYRGSAAVRPCAPHNASIIAVGAHPVGMYEVAEAVPQVVAEDGGHRGADVFGG